MSNFNWEDDDGSEKFAEQVVRAAMPDVGIWSVGEQVFAGTPSTRFTEYVANEGLAWLAMRKHPLVQQWELAARAKWAEEKAKERMPGRNLHEHEGAIWRNSSVMETDDCREWFAENWINAERKTRSKRDMGAAETLNYLRNISHDDLDDFYAPPCPDCGGEQKFERDRPRGQRIAVCISCIDAELKTRPAKESLVETDQSGPCVAFSTSNPWSVCVLENDHDGSHIMSDEESQQPCGQDEPVCARAGCLHVHGNKGACPVVSCTCQEFLPTRETVPSSEARQGQGGVGLTDSRFPSGNMPFVGLPPSALAAQPSLSGEDEKPQEFIPGDEVRWTYEDGGQVIFGHTNSKLIKIKRNDGEVVWIKRSALQGRDMQVAHPSAGAGELPPLDVTHADREAGMEWSFAGNGPDLEKVDAWTAVRQIRDQLMCRERQLKAALSQAPGDEKRDTRFDWFTTMMAAELQANASKGDWDSWRPDFTQAMSELHHHVGKLQHAALNEHHAGIREFSADVANIAMKIAEVLGLARAQAGGKDSAR
jgi:hypothetical protein